MTGPPSRRANAGAREPRHRRVAFDGGRPRSELPALPPADGTPATVLAVSGDHARRFHASTLAALVSELSPTAVVSVDPAARSVHAVLEPRTDAPVLSAGTGMRPDAVSENDVLVVATPSGGEFPLSSVADALSGDDAVDNASHGVVVSGDVTLSVDPYERETTLDGLADYLDRLPTELRDATHLVTTLRAGFRTEREGATLVGVGTPDADLGVGVDDSGASAAVVDVYANGAVRVESVDPGTFGLRGLSGVGPERVRALREAGFRTPDDVARTDPGALADLDGFGRSTARSVRAAADARANDRVVATGDDPLPSGDPVFVDIETDGLNPSTAWLVGVLDGDADSGTYLAFREPEPGGGAHLDAFVDWLPPGRPVVAWNGNRFDFPVLEAQLREKCPDRVDEWRTVYRFDALAWARDRNGGNAALPGRTNKLEDVAGALGWAPETVGIDGATVAETYTAWRRGLEADAAVDAPDWDRLEAYCEDDVRALATIYDALREAARGDGSFRDSDDGGTQGALSDFT